MFPKFRSDTAELITDQGFVHESASDRILGETESIFNLTWFSVPEWQAREESSGRPFAKYESFETWKAECVLSVVLQLFFQGSLDEAKKKVAVSIFGAIDSNRLATEGMSYIDELTEEARKKGLADSDYYVIQTYSLERQSEVSISNTRDALDRSLNLNLDGGDVRKYYLGGPISERRECGVPNLDLGGDDLEVPDVDDEVAVAERIKEKVLEEALKDDCSSLAYRSHRVGTLFQFPEFKTEWHKKRIKIGRCTLITVTYPKFFTRTRKNVLYVSTVLPDSVIDAMEKGAVECLIYSAGATALAALLTAGTGLVAAARIFASVFMTCIKNKFGNVVRCIIPDVSIAVEKGNWSAI